MAITVPDELIDIEWPEAPGIDWLGWLEWLTVLVLVLVAVGLLGYWVRTQLPGLKGMLKVQQLKKALKQCASSGAFHSQAKVIAFDAYQLLETPFYTKTYDTDQRLALKAQFEVWAFSDRPVSHETFATHLSALEMWIRTQWKRPYQLSQYGPVLKKSLLNLKASALPSYKSSKRASKRGEHE